MRKLVVLRLDGNLNVGVRVTLEIGEEGFRPSTEISGHLPPNPDIAKAIDQWQSTYSSLWKFTRIKAKKIVYDGSISQRREDCYNLTYQLRSQLNQWLLCESFRPVREKWLKHLMPEDEVRILIRTACLQLNKLPWHLWDLVDRDYPKAEVALSVPESEQIISSSQSFSRQKKINILAILGDSQGIDVEQDRQLLKKLPGAATTFLVEPQLLDLNDELWKQPWNILFFAGHSKTEGDTGRIYINATNSITITDLKYALKQAVAQGLQLAIFNSCDGLGLARELQDLQIPQVIVMREPVPDLVAQKFLKHFLEAFSSGQSIYAAVRTARERLAGLEKEYPGATWLPVICEHPGIVPMNWNKPKRFFNIYHFRNLLILSLLITLGVLGLRYQGGLQTWELQAYDQLVRSRPQEKQDSRLLIVTVTEEDFQLPEQKLRSGSLSDVALARLLEKLAQLKPRTIGLDIYRDQPSKLNPATFAERNLLAICKVKEPTKERPGISAPLGIPQERQGFSDIVLDADGVMRRHLLAMQPAEPTSSCTARYALNAQLAFHYLQQEGISAQYTKSGDLKIGNNVFQRVQSRQGGYQQADTGGYQILLNYRSYGGSPLKIAPIVTLTDVLRGKVNPAQVKDKIVLIGTTAQSFRDYISTPYLEEDGSHLEMPGVILQAQMISQLVSAVKDGRSILVIWPVWGEVLWIWSWALIGGVVAVCDRSGIRILLLSSGAISILYFLSLIFFCSGVWVPLVPSLLVLVVTAGSSAIYFNSPKNQRQLIAIS
ncbi:MAG: CHASE2 domain-containing protein [Nostoc sp. ChiSLP02]|nr:CHASE2 domain-containing protein [Nostoc sp. DedSLP05]MDZ8102342.1 CHASE2 domain-containing protein [Nostoc sp. DedSLP01]MDZ8188417.1 CHASE2 domain-containing protein [Nostoc sp. ChiSLP02]